MDSAASSLCMDNDIPLIVFSVMEKVILNVPF